MSDRQKAINFLLNSVNSAFNKGLKVKIGAFDYVFLKKGAEVEIGENIHETTAAGIFQITPVTRMSTVTGKHEFSHNTVLHYGHREQLPEILAHLCRDMSVYDIEMTMVAVTGHSVLSEKAISRRVDKEDGSSSVMSL